MHTGEEQQKLTKKGARSPFLFFTFSNSLCLNRCRLHRVAEFVKVGDSVFLTDCGQFIHNALPKVAFAGKSNVGKSSVINRLLNRRQFARVGATPGKTVHVNYFLIDGRLYLIDLPGYGFAKVDKAEKARWGKMMQDYFELADELRHVFCLVDIRHDPTEDDKNMNTFLRQMGIPFTVIATKADKISRAARQKHLAPICRALMVQPWEVICWSSEDGTGRDQVQKLIDEVLTDPIEEAEGPSMEELEEGAPIRYEEK